MLAAWHRSFVRPVFCCSQRFHPVSSCRRVFQIVRCLSQPSVAAFATKSMAANQKVLCVAEKNDAAKNISAILSSGRSTLRNGPARYNKLYCFDAPILERQSAIVFTSVSGHLKTTDFPPHFKNWAQVPMDQCFTAPILSFVPPNMKEIEQQLTSESRRAQILIIWTDCDREGENIGAEIVDVCRAANSKLTVYRARFSEITRRAVYNAINNLVHMDANMISAVDCRMELDLRLGAAFTRLQTLNIQQQIPAALVETRDKVVSYGSCQFPTLGFVVYRYLENINFEPEPFWKLVGQDVAKKVSFNWSRGHLFDQRTVKMYLEICNGNGNTIANVSEIKRSPRSRYRPYALDTVELEKLGVRKLKMTAKRVLAAAEKLYTNGYISYPRTETNKFPPDLDLNNLIQLQSPHQFWGTFAADILRRGNANPRNGIKSDAAHPPIHPLKIATKAELTNADEWRVYELVVRHFLACCSRDAKGNETRVTVKIAGETFMAFGLTIADLGYLEVYPYDKWSAKEIPDYQDGEVIAKFEVSIHEGTTTAPPLLTEADLIALMDKHGIGTDATHAEHIEKIKQRNYVELTSDNRFKPTFMGMALVDGYNRMGHESLSRPQLRAELESDLVDICEGRKTKAQVLANQINIYRNIFNIAERNVGELTISIHNFMGKMPG